MAKRSAKPAGGTDPSPPAGEASSSTPVPSDTLHATFTSLAQGEVLHRVHQSKYQADQFNPGAHGNARFSPIQDEHGKPIPTLCGSTTMACALMEWIFHDFPHISDFKRFSKKKVLGQANSAVQVERDPHFVDLTECIGAHAVTAMG